ncbi:hypothetical protein DFH06DRAFT_272515 [Mycena polygramma]|nr:hypothetical protein DFH06DRAFT_272515 [Mycena polygramma]
MASSFAFYDDLLLEVMERCDVCSVLTMGMTCVRFRTLSLSLQVWRAVVRELASSTFINLGDRKVQNLTVAELIDEVKRIVVGPKTWVPRRAQVEASPVNPELRRRKHLSKIHVPAGLLRVALLPGEKYIFFACETYFDIRDTITGAAVWTLQQGTLRYKIVCFELASEDVFMLLLYPEKTGPVQLIRVDLQTGQSAVVFTMKLQPCKDFEPCILGQFILASVKSPGRGDVHLLLFNWVTSRYMLFRLQMAHRVMAALIPGHIVLSVAEPVAPVRQLLLLFSLDDLRDHWRPLLPAAKMPFAYDACVDVFDRIYVFGRYPRVQTFVDEKEGWPGRQWQLRVFEDPLRRGSHRIFIYTSDGIVPFGYRKRETDLANLYSFRVTLDGSTAVDWKASPVVPAVPHGVKLNETFTYSGHCFALIGDGHRRRSIRQLCPCLFSIALCSDMFRPVALSSRILATRFGLGKFF